MRRWVVRLACCAFAVPLAAQVQTMGDVSFTVPDGYAYMQGPDFGTMVRQGVNTFWMMAVYTPMPASGDVTTDVKAAWQRIVLPMGDHQGWPLQPYYDITHTVGYPGKRADEAAISRKSYTRLYVLEAGSRFIPVVAISTDGLILNTQEHVANALLGSVRLAPLKAAPIKTTITLADLVGDWQSGMANSISFYNSSTGAYQGSSNSVFGASYRIAADGSFTYKMTGVISNQSASDSDSGVVELGAEFVTFKGRSHVVRYRFLNIQQAIDGSAVITFLPPAADPSTLNVIRDSEYWVRKK
jgi:hypothetical protein